LQRRMVTSVQCKVRVYMLTGFNFAKKDLLSKSDPYLVLRIGKKEFNEQENYQLDTDCPVFHKVYEFIPYFPGCPLLEISSYDYDSFFGDELIGKTQIDLDDR